LSKFNVKTIFLTRENSKIVKKRAQKIRIVDLYSNVLNKEKLLPKFLKNYSVKTNEIAYIGDDVNDIEIMKKVGFSATPSDGNFEVKKISDYICKNSGGNGAFREFSDLIIKSKSKN